MPQGNNIKFKKYTNETRLSKYKHPKKQMPSLFGCECKIVSDVKHNSKMTFRKLKLCRKKRRLQNFPPDKKKILKVLGQKFSTNSKFSEKVWIFYASESISLRFDKSQSR